MTSIELTEEHKSKLLEMCNKLFPEDKFSFNNDSGDDGIIDRNFAADNVSYNKRLAWNNDGSHFHWFEFCMTHLLYQFLKHSDVENLKYFDNVFMFWATHNTNSHIIDSTSKHPVDYLYEEFKKLKL